MRCCILSTCTIHGCRLSATELFRSPLLVSGANYYATPRRVGTIPIRLFCSWYNIIFSIAPFPTSHWVSHIYEVFCHYRTFWSRYTHLQKSFVSCSWEVNQYCWQLYRAQWSQREAVTQQATSKSVMTVQPCGGSCQTQASTASCARCRWRAVLNEHAHEIAYVHQSKNSRSS